MVASDESQVLGCGYFFPTDKVEYDVEVFLWVRESEVANDLCGVLFEVVQCWLTSHWPFDTPPILVGKSAGSIGIRYQRSKFARRAVEYVLRHAFINA